MKRIAEQQEKAFVAWMKDQGVERGILTIAEASQDPILNRGYGGQEPAERVLLASLSKPITGRCIARMIVENRLRLDTRMSDVLAPFFARFDKPADARVADITIAQLLDHRAGFAASPRDLMTSAAVDLLTKTSSPAKATPQELLAAALQTPLLSAPGSEEHYSNIGYLMLGVVIEVITGESYESYCGRTILEAAGIRDARLDSDWRAFSAFGGWKLSGTEYLRFLSAEPAFRCVPPTAADGDASRQTGLRTIELWKYQSRCEVSDVPKPTPPFYWFGQSVAIIGSSEVVASDPPDLSGPHTRRPIYSAMMSGSWGAAPQTYGLVAMRHNSLSVPSWFAWYTPRPPQSARDRLLDQMFNATRVR